MSAFGRRSVGLALVAAAIALQFAWDGFGTTKATDSAPPTPPAVVADQDPGRGQSILHSIFNGSSEEPAASAPADDEAWRADPWREKAIAGIRNVSPKVTDATWSQPISLWLEVRDDGTDWAKAGRSFCLTLDGAGRPKDDPVYVSFWLQDEVVAKITCD